MNILKNFQQFYDVYTDAQTVDWTGKELYKQKLAQQCYDINARYIQRQLETMKKKVTGANVSIYNAMEVQVKGILAKYLI